jgi:hypothetical protein
MLQTVEQKVLGEAEDILKEAFLKVPSKTDSDIYSLASNVKEYK